MLTGKSRDSRYGRRQAGRLSAGKILFFVFGAAALTASLVPALHVPHVVTIGLYVLVALTVGAYVDWTNEDSYPWTITLDEKARTYTLVSGSWPLTQTERGGFDDFRGVRAAVWSGRGGKRYEVDLLFEKKHYYIWLAVCKDRADAARCAGKLAAQLGLPLLDPVREGLSRDEERKEFEAQRNS